MKVREFIALPIDIDVYDNVCEELGIAFCGPLTVTPEGEKYFEEVLDCDIEISEEDGVAVVDVEGAYDEWRPKLDKAKEFFHAAAGYCAARDYKKWFE